MFHWPPSDSGWSSRNATDSIVDVAVGRIDDGFEEVVGALDFVPEHQVVLAELELLDVRAAPGGEAQQVQAGEHPAAAGLLLVGDAPVVEQRREGVVGLEDDALVQGDVVDVVARDGVLRQAEGRARDERALQTAQRLDRQRTRRIAIGGRGVASVSESCCSSYLS